MRGRPDTCDENRREEARMGLREIGNSGGEVGGAGELGLLPSEKAGDEPRREGDVPVCTEAWMSGRAPRIDAETETFRRDWVPPVPS